MNAEQVCETSALEGRYSLKLPEGENTSATSYCSPSSMYGITHVITVKESRIIVISVLEPALILHKMMKWKTDYYDYVIWRAFGLPPEQNSLESVRRFVGEAQKPTIVFVSLGNLFYHIPVDTVPGEEVRRLRDETLAVYKSTGPFRPFRPFSPFSSHGLPRVRRATKKKCKKVVAKTSEETSKERVEVVAKTSKETSEETSKERVEVEKKPIVEKANVENIREKRVGSESGQEAYENKTVNKTDETGAKDTKNKTDPDDFTAELRDNYIQQLFDVFGVSRGPLFPTKHMPPVLLWSMNCGGDPFTAFYPKYQEAATLADGAHFVLDVNYFSTRARRVGYSDNGQPSGLVHSVARKIATPPALHANWWREQTGGFFFRLREFPEPMYSQLQPTLERYNWVGPADYNMPATIERSSWLDIEKIYCIFEWVSALQNTKFGHQRLCIDYNARLAANNLCLKYIVYEDGEDQTKFVDFHLQEHPRLLEAFSTREYNLIAWPFLIGKLWPGIKCKMSFQVWLARFLDFVVFCFFFITVFIIQLFLIV